MSQFIFKMPDLGEGTVEAEIVAWHTKPGDAVKEDQIIVEVMTDKAAVEVPAPVGGIVVSITGEPGDKVAVGAPLIVFELAGGGTVLAGVPGATDMSDEKAAGARHVTGEDGGGTSRDSAGRVKTSPANRRRAREAGIDLATVVGSGPGGRIVAGDLVAVGASSAARSSSAAARGDAAVADVARGDGARRDGARGDGARGAAARADVARGDGAGAATTEIKVIGVRRVIAERMSEAKRNIPHFAYVEEVDVTELESLRQHLNGQMPKGSPSLTYLPLVAAALVRTLESFPQCNVLYDAARGVLVRHRAVHLGVATQTPDGLKVPVVRHAERQSLWELAASIRRVAERARTNQATRDELTGSTITVTSLGKLGGIASTPIINAPEVAIIGLNKAVERPVVLQGTVVVRRIMNLSSSFDHRFVDGYDAAAMVQNLKELLEHPATIFIPKVTIP
jgi:2-oxoisovalerate dehydrogenase E2 component (dihydrolipoyl transacylase)